MPDEARFVADFGDRGFERSGVLVQEGLYAGFQNSEATGLARNTVRARLSRYAAEESLHSFERRIDPAFLGFPLQAFIVTTVKQRKLSTVSDTLAEVPEVLQVHGLSGVADLLVHVAARDADDLYLGGRQFGPRFFPPARAEGVGRAPIPDECSASSSPGGLPT